MTLLQVTADLCVQVNDLDEVRRDGFLDWLDRHHRASAPTTRETLQEYLIRWLGGLSPQGMQWEVQLLRDEIAWWRNLSEARLWQLLNAERSQ